MPRDRNLLETVRRVRYRLAESGPGHVREEGDFERVSLPDSDCDVLRDLLIAEQARVIIEIGLAYGSSALAIGEALISLGQPDARHLIIDPHQEAFGNAGLDAIDEAGLGTVSELVAGRSQVVLPALAAEGFIADAAFVDGSHSFHNVFVDLYFLRELVRPGGLIVLDDCQWPSVATAVRYFEVNTGWQPALIDPPTRLRAFRLPAPPIEPDLESFQPFGSE